LRMRLEKQRFLLALPNYCSIGLPRTHRENTMLRNSIGDERPSDHGPLLATLSLYCILQLCHSIATVPLYCNCATSSGSGEDSSKSAWQHIAKRSTDVFGDFFSQSFKNPSSLLIVVLQQSCAEARVFALKP